MRAPPPPRELVRAPRTAAIQVTTAQPSFTYTKRRGGAPSAQYAKWQATYQDWQYDAKRFARTVGVARFTANMVAATASRCTLIIEERRVQDDGREEWVETEDPALRPLMNDYRNVSFGQSSSELVKLHCWHYGVVGEAALVTQDAPDGSGAEWMVVSLDAVQWDRPSEGQCTVKLHPSGIASDGTAIVLPRDNVYRYWLPDEEWLTLSISPMTASLDDLKRYRSLARFAQRSAENYLAMLGMLWTDPRVHASPTNVADDDDDPTTTNPARDPFMEGYNRYAQMSLDGDDQLGAFVPPVFWSGDPDTNPPQFIDFKHALDPEGIAHRREALEDWARGVDAPASLVIGGGSSDENHWGAWITQERFIAAVAPTLDRVTHQDLTVAFLVPQLRLMGKSEADLDNYRVGYDSTAVIVHPDKSDKALRLFLSGLLSGEATRRENGFDESDKPSEEDLALLAKVLTGFASQAPAPTPGEIVLKGRGTGTGPPATNGGGGAPHFGQHRIRPGVEPNVKEPGEKAGPGTVVQGPPSSTFTSPGARASAGPHEILDEFLPPVRARAAAAAETGVSVSLPTERGLLPLIYVGDIADMTDATRGSLQAICAGLASDEPCPDVALSHVERVSANGHGTQVVMIDSGPDVYALRERLVQMCDAAGVPWRDDQAFRAHVTVGYYDGDDGPRQGALATAETFQPDALMLHWGDEVSSYPFVDAPDTGALPPDAGIFGTARRAYSEDQPRDAHGRFGQGDGAPRQESAAKEEMRVVDGIRASMTRAFPNARVSMDKATVARLSEVKPMIDGTIRAALGLARDYPEVAGQILSVKFGSAVGDPEGNILGEFVPGDKAGDITLNVAAVADTRPENLMESVGGLDLDPQKLGEGLMTHEFGHAVDHAAGGTWNNPMPNGEREWAKVDAAYRGGDPGEPHISWYSGDNPADYFAEAFSADRLGYGDLLLTDSDRAMLEGAGVHRAAAVTPTVVDSQGRHRDTFDRSIIWRYAADKTKARVAYSEDQPRDYHGRFGEGTEIDVLTGAIHTERAAMDQLNEKTQADVLKNVSAKISTNPEDIEGRYRALMESARGTPAWQEGMNWYSNVHDEGVRIAEDNKVPFANVAAALAAQSSGAHWSFELPVTEAMIQMDKGTVQLDDDRLRAYNGYTDEHGEHVDGKIDRMAASGTPIQPIENGMSYKDLDPLSAVVAMQLQYTQNLPEGHDPGLSWGIGHGFKFFAGALDLLRNDQVDDKLSGPKYRSFYDNIVHPESERAVTIDKFMVGAAADKWRNDERSVATGRVKSTIFNDSNVMGAPSRARTVYDENGVKSGVLKTTIGPTPYLADVIRKIADDEGILPQQAQAIIWVQAHA